MAYSTIREAVETLSCEKQKHNLYVITGECTAAKRTRGADWYSVLKVTDPSLCDDDGVNWQDIQVFAPGPPQMPQPRNFYDIIRLHRVMVQEFNGRAQLVASLGRFSSYCLYDGRPQARPQRMRLGALEPYQTSGTQYSSNLAAEAAVQASLRALAQQLRSGSALAPGQGASPYQRTIQAIEPNTFFDLTCKVLSLEVPSPAAAGRQPAHATRATLYVWDGTDARPFPHGKDTRMEDSHGWRALGGSEVDAEEARQEMERLQRLPMLPYAPQEDEGDPSSLPNLGTALPVVLFMLHQPVLLPPLGSWMRLRNVYCCVIAGQLQARSSIALYTAKSKWSCALPSNEALDFAEARRRACTVASWADPQRLLGSCLHPEQPFSSLRQVSLEKGALVRALSRQRSGGAAWAAQQGAAMHVGKFRCLVRVTAHRPLDVSQLCARREECFPPASPGAGEGGWLYAMQLTLEDATGEVDANLFDVDGEAFFQGLAPQDLQGGSNAASAALRRILHTLLGHHTDREGGEWLDCCLKLFYGARGVCLRMFDTQLSDQTMAAAAGDPEGWL